MASAADKRGFNNLLGTVQGSAQQNMDLARGRFASGMDDWSRALAGLQRPGSFEAANEGFDAGVGGYGAQAGQYGQDVSRNLAGTQDMWRNLYNNAGYTPQEQAGMKSSMAAGWAAPYAQAANEAQLSGIRTGQTTGQTNALGKLAREKGRMVSSGLSGLQGEFGKARMAGQQSAAEGYTGATTGLLGKEGEALQLSQFPTQARLARMGQELDATKAAGAPAEAWGQYSTSNLGTLAGILGVRQQQANKPGFWGNVGNAFAQSLGSAPSRLTGSLGGGFSMGKG